jgi:mRNA degradation ribonuclease J1/J2
LEIKVASGGLIDDCRGSVGGTQLLLRQNLKHLWLDMGVPPYALRNLKFPYETQIVPKLPPERLGEMKILPFEDIKTIKENMLNLLISHVHLDHYGLVNYADAFSKMGVGLNIFAEDALHNLLLRRQNISRQARKIVESYNPSPLREMDEKGWRVSGIGVNHSIDAAFAYLIEEEKAGTICYTGDYRFTENFRVEDFAKKLGNIDLFITEATRTTSKVALTEDDVVEKTREIARRYNGLTIFLVGWYTFTKRIESIIKSVQGRKIVLFSQIAYLLEHILPQQEQKNLFILKRKQNPTGWERDFLKRQSNVVDFQWVNDNRDDVALILPEIMKLFLFPEAPTDNFVSTKSGDVVIASLSEAYDEESFSNLQRLEEYVNRDLKLPLYNVHASGHASIHEIADLIDTIRPNNVIVVHSPYPQVLKSVVKKYNPDKILIPKNGQTLSF